MTMLGQSEQAHGAGAVRYYDVARIRAALTRERVVDHCKLDVHEVNPSWWRGRQCPACNKTWSEYGCSGFCLGTRGWHCKACGVSGDLLDLLGRVAGLQGQFPQMLALASAITGVAADDTTGWPGGDEPPVRSRLVDDGSPSKEDQRRTARVKSLRAWNMLSWGDDAGQQFLRTRGLDDRVLIRRRLVRFWPHHWDKAKAGGAPCVPLYDWDGGVLNVVRRHVDDRSPKVAGLRGAPTDGTLLGRLAQIRRGIDVVVTEGVMDSLTAALAWPTALVLGAHGASNVAKVCAAAAPRVKAAGARMRIVPHGDAPGQRVAIAGGMTAREAGLRVGEDLLFEEPETDLNDAWRQGWRP